MSAVRFITTDRIEKTENSEPVDYRAQSGDHSRGDIADKAFRTERFPAVDVGKMNFHDGNAGGEKGIPDRDAGMGIGPEICDNPRYVLVLSLVDAVDKRPFVVGLVEEGFESFPDPISESSW